MAKRERKKDRHNLRTHYGYVFWQECHLCKDEFRREKGWSAIVGPYYLDGHGVTRGSTLYLCASCGPTREKALRCFNDLNRPAFLPPRNE